MKKIIGLTMIAAAALSGCNSETAVKTDAAKAEVVKTEIEKTNSAQDIVISYNSINKEQLIEHIKVLSSDEFEGRAPSSKGEKLTLDYLTKQLTAIGFKPAVTLNST